MSHLIHGFEPGYFWSSSRQVPPFPMGLDSPFDTSPSNKPTPRPPKKPIYRKHRVTKKDDDGKSPSVSFLDLPECILLEILPYLKPMDLLNLLRVNSCIRTFLGSPFALPIWKRSIGDLRLPRCPPDLNEIEYLQFAFEPLCNFCGKTRAAKDLHRLYYTRRKVCMPCTKTIEFVEIKSYDSFRAVLPVAIVQIAPRNGGSKITTLWAPKSEVVALENEYRSLMDDDVRKEWFEEKRSASKAHFKIEQQLTSWDVQRISLESRLKIQVKEDRCVAILEKLRGLDWGDEIDNMPFQDREKFKQLRCVAQNAELNEQAWKKMQPELTKFMQEIRRKRLRKEDILLNLEKQRAEHPDDADMLVWEDF